MASLTVTVPNTLVAELVTIATAKLTSLGVDTKSMTSTQIGQRYIAELLKVELIKYRHDIADQTAQDAYAAALATAIAQANTTKSTAVSGAAGITG